MNEIQEFTIPNLRNDEAYYFHDKITKEAFLHLNWEGDEPMVTAYQTAVTAFDEVLKLDRTNSFSDDVQKAIQDTDTCWRGMRNQLKAMMAFPHAEKSAIAKAANEIVEKYGDITRMSQGDRYGNLSNLTQDLRAMPEADLQAINLDIWITELEVSGSKHMIAHRSFINEEASRVKGITQQRRTEADEAFKTLVKRVNALELINADGRHLDFINNVNILIDKEKTKLAARHTRAENKKDAGDLPV